MDSPNSDHKLVVPSALPNNKIPVFMLVVFHSGLNLCGKDANINIVLNKGDKLVFMFACFLYT